MKIAIMASLLAKRNMNIDAGHLAKIEYLLRLNVYHKLNLRMQMYFMFLYHF